MCSIGEDDLGDEGGLHCMAKDSPFFEQDLHGTCKRCSQKGIVIKLNFREPECKECFLVYVRHKFRAALGSSKVLPKGAKVLLLFDGSAESLVLLDMMHYALAQNNFKRLNCTTRVLYIDKQLMHEDVSQTKSRVKNIASLLNQLHTFDKFIMRFTAAPTKPMNFEHMDDYLAQVGRFDEGFVSDINAIRSLTARQDYVKNQRNRLIAAACAHLDCDFVFLPDISTNLATQLLTDIALGRGGSVALNVSLLDDRLSGLKLVRPIKDLNELEVSHYLQVQGLKPIITDLYGEHFGDSASLQNLTKAFVGNLQKNFSSTVSTIFRTGDKIAPNTQLDQQMQNLNVQPDIELKPRTCAFCHSSLDYFGSSSILATEFSRIVSESGAALINSAKSESVAKKNICNDEEALKKYCHACRNILNECPNKNLLI